MKQNVEFKGFEPDSALRELIQQAVKSLSKRSQRFSSDAVGLRLVLSLTRAHKLYRLSVTLDVPGKTLVSRTESHHPDAGVREVFAEIERQLETHKAALRGQHWRKRLEHKHTEEAKPFFETVAPFIENLTAFARHLIAHAESRGDLAVDEWTAEDLVDATLIEASTEFASRRAGSIRAWLLRTATRLLDQEMKRSGRERSRTVHIEDDAPETPRREWVTTLGEEILDFYQPEEDLKIEDLLPDLHDSNPEQQVEDRELTEGVRSALQTLPKLESRALLLRYVAGIEGADLQGILGLPGAEVERLIENARDHLRTALVAAGCGVGHDPSRSSTGVLNALHKQMS